MDRRFEARGMTEPGVGRSFSRPNVQLRCRCGWEGADADVEEWAVERDRDRVVRRCPSCGDAVPEWGALRTVAGAARVARGPLAESLAAAGVDVGDESTPDPSDAVDSDE